MFCLALPRLVVGEDARGDALAVQEDVWQRLERAYAVVVRDVETHVQEGAAEWRSP